MADLLDPPELELEVELEVKIELELKLELVPLTERDDHACRVLQSRSGP